MQRISTKTKILATAQSSHQTSHLEVCHVSNSTQKLLKKEDKKSKLRVHSSELSGRKSPLVFVLCFVIYIQIKKGY